MGLTIVKTDGNIEFVSDVADGVCGFLANGVSVVGGIQLDTVYNLRSLSDVTSLGIDEDYDTDNSVLVYEHLKEAYRINPEADIRIMLVGKNVSYTNMVDPAQSGNAKKLLQSESGDIKMLYVAYNPTVAVADYNATIAAITMAQTLYTSEYALGRRIHIFLEGKGFSASDPLPVFSGFNAGNVSVVNGQALSVGVSHPTYAAIGVVMGTYSKIPVNESGAWVAQNNLYGGSLTEAAIGGVNISSITDGTLAAIIASGSIVFQKQPVAGVYMNAAPVCDTKSNTDYYTIELCRTINKVIDIIEITLAPSLSEPMKVDPATGFLPPEKVLSEQSALQKALVDAMEKNDEISGVKVALDPFQNMIENPKRIIKYKVVPTSTGVEIEAQVGFASSI